MVLEVLLNYRDGGFSFCFFLGVQGYSIYSVYYVYVCLQDFVFF